VAFANDGIHAVDVRSGQVRRLTPLERFSMREPRWSPDGGRLVFVSEASLEPPYGVGSCLEVVRADGSERTRITPEVPVAVPTVVPATSVARPDRLVIPIVVDTPDAVRPGGVVTARVTVRTAMLGDFVDGAHVWVVASPGTVIRAVPRVARTVAGRATMRIRLLRVPRRARTVSLLFFALRPGDTTVSSAPYEALVTLRR
jgi:WD40-like Beta Propeller Repeat